MLDQSIQSEVGPLPNIPMIPPRAPAGEDQPERPPQPLIYLPQKSGWRYKTVVRNRSVAELLTDQELNQLGEEGWELVGLLPLDHAVYFYFKQIAD